MQTITLETDISHDGALNISIPSGLPPGKVEVVLVIQPKTELDESISHKEQTESNGKANANGSSYSSDGIQVEQGKRMMELLTIALKGVEWQEIEEGRANVLPVEIVS